MSSAERKKPVKDILGDIDAVLGAPSETLPFKWKPASVTEVQTLTNFIFGSGTGNEKEDLTELKDTVVGWVRKPAIWRRFPDNKPFVEGYKNLQDQYEVYKATADKESKLVLSGQIQTNYREFRNKTLSHVLSTNPNALPENFRDSVIAVDKRYAALKTRYDTRFSSNA